MTYVDLDTSHNVARVTLKRPPLNVIDLAMARELAQVLERVGALADIRAVVLSGEGKAFSAGVDVRDHLPDRGAEMIHEFHRACLALIAIEVPVIASVHGAALGGGSELTLSCDIVLAAQTATFGFPEIKLGVFPPVAAVGLGRVVGFQHASDLVLTGRTIDAEEAERIGLVCDVVPDADLPRATESFAAVFSELSADALRSAKRALSIGRPRPTRDEIAAAEALYMDERLTAPDAIEGLRAFMEKRAPSWSRR